MSAAKLNARYVGFSAKNFLGSMDDNALCAVSTLFMCFAIFGKVSNIFWSAGFSKNSAYFLGSTTVITLFGSLGSVFLTEIFSMV